MNQRRGNLGFGTGIITLMLMISFSLYLLDCTSYSPVFLKLVQGDTNNCGLDSGASAGMSGSLGSGVYDITSVIFGDLGVLGVGTLIAFGVGIANGYALFAPAAFFLLGGFTLPTGIFNANSSLPLELRVLLVVFFGTLSLFAVLEYAGAKRF